MPAAVALMLFVAPSLHGQGLRDRLKKAGVTVTTGKEKEAAKKPEAAQAGAPAKRTGPYGPDATLPASSVAHPEVYGMKLGVTTLEEARAILAKATPALLIGSAFVDSLEERSQTAQMDVYVPNSRHVKHFSGLSMAYASQTDKQTKAINGPDECDKIVYATPVTNAKGNCESIKVYFAALPGSPVVALERTIIPSPQPLLEVMEKSLVERYGEPTLRSGSGYSWFWDAAGKLMPPQKNNAGCSSSSLPDPRAAAYPGAGADPDKTAKQVAAGCAAVVDVQLRLRSNLVEKVAYSGGDLYTGAMLFRRSQFLKDSVVRAYDEKQRAAAASVKPPE
jgi:hypothetical protein